MSKTKERPVDPFYLSLYERPKKEGKPKALKAPKVVTSASTAAPDGSLYRALVALEAAFAEGAGVADVSARTEEALAAAGDLLSDEDLDAVTGDDLAALSALVARVGASSAKL